MRNISLIILIAFCFFLSVKAQQTDPDSRSNMCIMFYNVENLFDTFNDSLTDDEEFLPGSTIQWDNAKYEKKLETIAGVISSASEKKLPAIIGLAEVENRKVLEDLAAEPRLRKGKYGIIHFNSRDERGMDVALLFDRDVIEVEESRPIPVSFGKDIKDVTRDILYARCRIKSDRVLHVYINHWPSRSPDVESSEIKRTMAALALRRDIDIILNNDSEAAVIVMGDFNDEPTNRSIFQVLNATNRLKNTGYRDLYNLMFDMHNIRGEGTLVYRDSWQMFDQIIVSGSLLRKGQGYSLNNDDGKIFRNESLVLKDPDTGNIALNMTFAGSKYLGGASDHLPVYVVLRKDEK